MRDQEACQSVETAKFFIQAFVQGISDAQKDLLEEILHISSLGRQEDVEMQRLRERYGTDVVKAMGEKLKRMGDHVKMDQETLFKELKAELGK